MIPWLQLQSNLIDSETSETVGRTNKWNASATATEFAASGSLHFTTAELFLLHPFHSPKRWMPHCSFTHSLSQLLTNSKGSPWVPCIGRLYKLLYPNCPVPYSWIPTQVERSRTWCNSYFLHSWNIRAGCIYEFWLVNLFFSLLLCKHKLSEVQMIAFPGQSCCYQLVNYCRRCRRRPSPSLSLPPSKNRLAKYSISFFGCQTALRGGCYLRRNWKVHLPLNGWLCSGNGHRGHSSD